VHDAIRKTLQELQTPGSGLLEVLKRVSGADVGAEGFKFGFKLDSIGNSGGPTLAQALTEVVDQAKTDLVLIIDEVQHAISSDDSNRLLLALKAARDAINPRPDTPGYFLFIGTGSHRAQVSELTAKRNQAFSGATSTAYPVLKGDYVEYLLNRLAATVKKEKLPSLEVAIEAFNTLGNRPEEMLKALRQLMQQEGDPDLFLPVIASTLRSAAASIELEKVELLGSLAQAIFGVFQGSCRVSRLTMPLFSRSVALDPGSTTRCRPVPSYVFHPTSAPAFSLWLVHTAPVAWPRPDDPALDAAQPV
jgi:hypothetical protein